MGQRASLCDTGVPSCGEFWPTIACARHPRQRNVRTARATTSILYRVPRSTLACTGDGRSKNSTVLHNFRKGRAWDATVHSLLRALFEVQMREGFWLRLRWIPSEVNFEAGGISRPGRDEYVLSALMYLQGCGLSLARYITILWLRPRRPTASQRLRRGRAIDSPVSRDTRGTVPREWVYFLNISLMFRERQRARSVSVFPQPHWPTQ